MSFGMYDIKSIFNPQMSEADHIMDKVLCIHDCKRCKYAEWHENKDDTTCYDCTLVAEKDNE